MTEQEWLAATDPTPMLKFWWGRASDRKLRLFAVACCRAVAHLVSHPRLNLAGLDVAERYAEGAASEAEREAVLGSGRDVGLIEGPLLAVIAMDPEAFFSAEMAVEAADRQVGDTGPSQMEWMRDIFGNPFRPVTINPAWITSDVIALAEGIYQDRAFDRMPILADALQDAGCDNADMLDHCRGPGPHVRGCHVLDLILGRS